MVHRDRNVLVGTRVAQDIAGSDLVLVGSDQASSCAALACHRKSGNQQASCAGMDRAVCSAAPAS